MWVREIDWGERSRSVQDKSVVNTLCSLSKEAKENI